MLVRSIVAAAAVALLAAGSSTSSPALAATRSALGVTADTGMSYAATLAAPAGYSGSEKVTGTATVTPEGKGFKVDVSIEGAAPNSTHPWHVHTGTCDKSDGVVGSGSDYKPIQVDAQGKGSATATVSVPLPDGGTVVNVHESPANMKTIVACGALEMKM